MEGSGIWALDCDVPPGHAHDGVANLAALVNVHGELPTCPRARSGGGGLVLFFRDRGERIIGEAGHPAPGIDPRRGRQSQSVPPSRHWCTGLPYRWLVAPWEVAPPPAPAWLLRFVARPPLPAALPAVPRRLPDTSAGRRRYALAALRRAAGRTATAPPGTRNDRLNSETFGLARFIAEGCLDPSEIATTMAYAARQAGLRPREIEATLASALAAGAQRERAI